MEDKKPKKRAPNWLASEKRILVDLVKEHFHIVENKKTDGATQKQKLAEWKLIESKYNSRTSYCARSAENLKAQWDSAKKIARKEEGQNRIHMIQTGGGPAKEIKYDPLHDDIIAMIKTSATGLHNPFDGDALTTIINKENIEDNFADRDAEKYKILEKQPSAPCSESAQNLQDLDVYIEEFSTADLPEPVPSCSTTTSNSETQQSLQQLEPPNKIKPNNKYGKFQDWGDYTPQLLRTPVSKQLKPQAWTSRRRPHTTTSSIELLHKKKIDAIDVQKEVAVKEAKKATIIADLDIKIKKEQLKQEKLKTQLLILELRKSLPEFQPDFDLSGSGSE